MSFMIKAYFFCFINILFLMASSPLFAQDTKYISWQSAKDIPDNIGFAGSFAGVSNDALLVAGGANFPDGGAPWTGSEKVWHDQVYALDQPDGEWKLVGQLPMPLGYGVSISWNGKIILIGGSNAEGHYSEAYMMTYSEGSVNYEKLPNLPEPVANSTGVLLNNKIYILGGIRYPDSKEAGQNFWTLDLGNLAQGWQINETWPGPTRMLAVAGVQDNAIFLFSGVYLHEGKREYLKDAYRFTEKEGWSKLAELPVSIAAAPSPALSAGQSNLIVFGGDDGSNANLDPAVNSHPGFSKDIFSYNIITNVWVKIGSFPDLAPVTTPMVQWKEKIVIPGGEIKPSVRTNKVWFGEPMNSTGTFKGWDWTVLGAYFLLTLGIGIFASRGMNGTTADFFLAEGKIPGWAAGLSIFGTVLSALTFIAIPAKAYATNWVYFMNNMMIVAVAPLIVYFYLPYFRKLKVTSIYEYLEVRFNRPVKLLASLTFLLFQLGRLGVVIYLPSLVLSSIIGIDLTTCIVVTSLVTTVYCFFGGIEAVVWTDVMQVFVLLGGALASLIFIIFSIDGGFPAFFSEASDSNKFQWAVLESTITEPVLWVVLVGGFLSQLVTFSSDQVVVQRYLTTSSEKEARKSIYINALLTIPASIIFFGVGTALWVYFKHHPAEVNPFGRTDDIFPGFITNQLPSGLSGLVIAGVFAATMSTISSSMNSMATVITKDFFVLLRPNSSDKKQFNFARITTVCLGLMGAVVSIYIASLQNSSIWDQYITIIGLLGGCLAGMFTAGIFFPKINSTGMLVGFVFSAIVLYIVHHASLVNLFLYPAIAIFASVGIAYLVSLFFPTKKPENDISMP